MLIRAYLGAKIRNIFEKQVYLVQNNKIILSGAFG